MAGGNNMTDIMVSSRLILSPIMLLIIIISSTVQAATLAQPQPAADLLNHFCSNDKGNYTTTDSYSTNLNHLLSSLPSTKGNDFGFYNSSYGGNTSSEAIYAIGLCKGDIGTTSDCLQCLNASRSALMELCPNQKEAIIWYDNCMLRYSNRSIYGVMETQPTFDMWSTQSVPSSKFDMFFRNLTILLERLGIQAAADGSLKFAKDNATILNYGNGGLSSLTALVECTPDLSELQCRTCLLGAFEEFPECCDGKEGGRVLRPSCNFNYQLDQVDRTKTTIPESGSPSQSPGIAPSQSPWNSSPIPRELPDKPDKIHPKSRARRAAASNHRIARIVIPFAVVVSIGLMISVGIYMKVEKRRPQPIPGMQPNSFETMGSLQFDCGDIRVATNNFSEANKLGDDEYGTVYRGSLSNDKSIAVRRLSINYVKEYMEIKKEVLLMAPKLQHPNLVELLGCALEENSERLLVYEHFPNATLDRIIFDRMQSRQWDWEMRYNIIVSIARGLLHLHDSHFVHGDINASNILIDAEMNPKISNFGMARFFAADQTQGNINGIHLLNLMSSTYMAPEAIVGHSSAESDVYSFGALVVEIVSGQEISSLASEKLNDKDLLRFAWKNWAEGTIRNLIDPTLWTGSGIEVMERCIRIGLLCMQRTRTDRPTMSSVTQMLSHSSAIPLPNKFRHGSFGIIGTLNNVEGVSDPRSRAKVQPFIAKMRCSTTGIINKIRRK
ncbi:putative protein kinase RLK-Pelle-DLSV family [Rosa chinensis]|uniref:non-specific serine/threonine protein kinase n=2 Tax=Rosa chinensis TaxID=74649 RepID=A0A2P6SLR3_ROSCH|nr:putative protein kinase RLK-Pelle-DLSV family [Rosa chinensis]